jgi:hypothetical protein
MAKKFSNLLLTPDSYNLTERLSQQPLFNFSQYDSKYQPNMIFVDWRRYSEAVTRGKIG